MFFLTDSLASDSSNVSLSYIIGIVVLKITLLVQMLELKQNIRAHSLMESNDGIYLVLVYQTRLQTRR